ncbi:MAG: hypothetical protein LPK21_01400 [Hymenobacteraceae bacterium]|nr:hypothetical protein [Hymenobacteraceae bacterium]MDX5510863.1 hypothetical protein [Hymenobacteraceae bacterium]
MGVNSSSELESVLGDIMLVEDEHITKYLGQNYYEQLHERYNSETPAFTSLEQRLLDHLQAAISNLAQESYLDLNQVQISSSGIRIISNDREKTAFKWQIDNLRQSFLKKGYNQLERVLAFLEDHRESLEFAAWAASPASTVFHQYFINTAAEFSAEYNIDNSRLTYLALLPILKKQERFLVEPVVGPALFEELKTQIKDRSLTEENEKLLQDFIRPALAHLVVCKAAVENSFKLTSRGLELTYGRQDDRILEKGEADDQKLNLKIKEAHQDGQAFLVKLRNYLNENASEEKFTAYFNSAIYIAPGTEPKDVVIRNTNAAAPTFKLF